MNRNMIVGVAAAALLAGCMVASRRGGGLEVVPILPTLVELDFGEPYYVQNGYHYHYSNERWHYANSRSGPWTELPRSHWPRETRWRNRNGDNDRNRNRNGDKDRDRH